MINRYITAARYIKAVCVCNVAVIIYHKIFNLDAIAIFYMKRPMSTVFYNEIISLKVGTIFDIKNAAVL